MLKKWLFLSFACAASLATLGAQTAIPMTLKAERAGSPSSVDSAMPPLSAQEREFALTKGFVFEPNPMRCCFRGKEVDYLWFLRAIGMSADASAADEWQKTTVGWNWGSAISALAMGTGLVGYGVQRSSDLSLSPLDSAWGIVGIAGSAALTCAIAGGLFHQARKPRAPSFAAIAEAANAKNRELMAKSED
jgi:hypothetical protein